MKAPLATRNNLIALYFCWLQQFIFQRDIQKSTVLFCSVLCCTVLPTQPLFHTHTKKSIEMKYKHSINKSKSNSTKTTPRALNGRLLAGFRLKSILTHSNRNFCNLQQDCFSYPNTHTQICNFNHMVCDRISSNGILK